jgi:hypothetical protein
LFSPVARRRNDRLDAPLAPGIGMDALAVVGGVGQKLIDPGDPAASFLQRLPEVPRLVARPKTGPCRKNQMALAIANSAEAGPPGGHVLGRSGAGFRLIHALDVVAAGVPGLEPGPVDGGPDDLAGGDFGLEGDGDNGVEQLFEAFFPKETLLGLLQRRVVRNAAKPDRLTEFGAVFKQRRHAAVVGLKELFEHQAGDQLRLRVGVRGMLGGIGRKRERGSSEGDQKHFLW